MSNFICDQCGTYIYEGKGGHYVTGCEHYPMEQMNPQTPDNEVDGDSHGPYQNLPHCGAEKLTGMIAKTAWKFGNSTDLEGFRSNLCREREARQKAEADARTLANAVRRLHRQLLGLEESELGNENQKLRELLERALKVQPLHLRDVYEVRNIQHEYDQLTK